jgi:hypothetical protein
VTTPLLALWAGKFWQDDAHRKAHRVLSTRGLNVAAAKHAHHAFDINPNAEDAFQYCDAGAWTVVISSAKRFAVLTKVAGKLEPTLAELVRRLGLISSSSKASKTSRIQSSKSASEEHRIKGHSRRKTPPSLPLLPVSRWRMLVSRFSRSMTLKRSPNTFWPASILHGKSIGSRKLGAHLHPFSDFGIFSGGSLLNRAGQAANCRAYATILTRRLCERQEETAPQSQRIHPAHSPTPRFQRWLRQPLANQVSGFVDWRAQRASRPGVSRG